MNKNNITIGALILALVCVIVLCINREDYHGREYKKQKELYEEEIGIYIKRLERSKVQRDSLNVRIDSLSDIYQSLVVADSIKSAQIDSLKGAYDHLSGSELEEMMIREWKRYDQ